MLTALAWVGRIFSPAVASLTPGISPRLIMALAGALVILVAVGAPAGAVYIHMHGKQREAVSVERVACDLRISQGEAESATILAGIMATIQEDDGDEPENAAAERKLCKRSKLCRENGR